MSISKLSTDLPASVTIVEVGPRDGLQNEATPILVASKVAFIDALADAGLTVIEVTSFVDPRWVPQLSDADEVLAALGRRPGVRYPVLVPNERGLDRALEAGVREISIFGSATESFSMRNLDRSRADAVEMFRPVCTRALASGLRVRAYLSMVMGDPWEGDVALSQVVESAMALLELGATELSLGDTIGVGTAGKVQDLIEALVDSGISVGALAVHFHDTYGQGLANVLAALQTGVSIVDSSAGGLGGCPYAKSATGNLATEDVVWMLEGLGISTGIDINAVALAAKKVCDELGKEVPGRVARALLR